METAFSDEDWVEFLACARSKWDSGEFIHNEFEAKRQEKHRTAHDRNIRQAMALRAYLVAYRDEGKERVTLWDPDGTGYIVVATLQDGIMTAYPTGSFENSLRSKTDIRWLHRPK